MTDTVRYAKKDIYAQVDEEGGKINRLIATAGDPISPAYAQYVDDKDTTTDTAVASDIARSTSARRAKANPDERSHEEMREVASGPAGPANETADGDAAPKRPRRRS